MYRVIASVFDVHTTIQIKIHNSSVSLKPTHNNKLRTIIGVWIGSMQCLHVPSQLQNTLTKCQTSSRSHVLSLYLLPFCSLFRFFAVLSLHTESEVVRSSQVTKVHEICILYFEWQHYTKLLVLLLSESLFWFLSHSHSRSLPLHYLLLFEFMYVLYSPSTDFDVFSMYMDLFYFLYKSKTVFSTLK